MPQRLVIAWSPVVDERDDDTVDLSRAVGLDGDALVEFEGDFPSPVTLSLEHGSVGKGGSATAVALYIDAERRGTDVASLIAIGGALWKVIERVTRRRGAGITLNDDATFATRHR
ncbi:MAG TPA: hypothetical protein VGO03_01140 [Acidimicrobiia bacterium]|jgi:hypothetical protein